MSVKKRDRTEQKDQVDVLPRHVACLYRVHSRYKGRTFVAIIIDAKALHR